MRDSAAAGLSQMSYASGLGVVAEDQQQAPRAGQSLRRTVCPRCEGFSGPPARSQEEAYRFHSDLEDCIVTLSEQVAAIGLRLQDLTRDRSQEEAT